MKRIFTKLALLFTAVLLSAKTYAYDFTVDSIYYTVTSMEDMTCMVVRGDEAYKGDIVIPSTVTYNGKTLTVTELQDSLFYNNSRLKSIDLPDGLTTIGEYAFSSCHSLTSIDLPDGLTTIGEDAFSGCSSLTSFDIPNSVTSIGVLIVGNNAKLGRLTIGASIQELPIEEFDGEYPYSTRLFTYSHSVIPYITLYKSDAYISNLIIADSNHSLTIPTRKPHYFYLNQIQNIYVGREINGEFDMPLKKIEFGGYCTKIEPCYSMQTLILGENIDTVNLSLIETQDSLSAIYIKTPTPPHLINDFTNKVYINTKLYVPMGAKETYQNADGWKNFWIIEETNDFNGVTSIPDMQTQEPEVTILPDGITIKEADGATISVYSIDGKLLYTTTGYNSEKIPLRSGIYIIKANGKSCKVKI